jgi:hypothetical protein
LSNPEKTNGALLEYGKKMLEHGDSWRSVRSYLANQTPDEDQVNSIIKTLSDLEREGHIIDHLISPENESKARKVKWNYIIGFTLMGLGVFLFSFLWYSGWIAILPLIIFVAGLIVINGGNPAILFRR